MSRRKFLKKGAAAAIGLAVVPGTVLGKKFGHTAPSDKLNILGVGIGGRGSSVLRGLESQNIIGLCDVDWKYADHVFKRYPAAKKYNDYRKMFDEMLKSADAVMVATADHTHAIIDDGRQARLRREAPDAYRIRIASADQARRQI